MGADTVDGVVDEAVAGHVDDAGDAVAEYLVQVGCPETSDVA